jgi:hypothetical protein
MIFYRGRIDKLNYHGEQQHGHYDPVSRMYEAASDSKNDMRQLLSIAQLPSLHVAIVGKHFLWRIRQPHNSQRALHWARVATSYGKLSRSNEIAPSSFALSSWQRSHTPPGNIGYGSSYPRQSVRHSSYVSMRLKIFVIRAQVLPSTTGRHRSLGYDGGDDDYRPIGD